MCKEFNIKVLCLQEVRLTADQLVFFRNLAAWKGYDVFASPPELKSKTDGVINGLMTLVDQCHTAKRIKDKSCRIDKQRALIVQLMGERDEPHLIFNTHIRSVWGADRKREFVREMLNYAKRCHACCRIMGDWNMEPAELLPFVLDDSLVLHDSEVEMALPTRFEPDDTPGRHIDYLASTPNCTGASGRRTHRPTLYTEDQNEAPTYSDHIVILYDIDICTTQVYAWPKRIALDGSDVDIVRQKFYEFWELYEDVFLEAAIELDTDTMWRILSDGAEFALAKDEPGSTRGLPRGLIGMPLIRDKLGSADCQKSELLRRLDNFTGRLRQYRKQNFDTRLLDKLRRNLKDLSPRIHELTSISSDFSDEDLELLLRITEQVEANENEQARLRANNFRAGNLYAATRWVTADLRDEQSVLQPVSNLDPLHRLRAESQPWQKRWNRPVEVDPNTLVDMMDELGWPKHEFEGHITFDPQMLLNRAKKIHNSSGSADNWSPRFLPSLPMAWYEALATLGRTIFLLGGKIPAPWHFVRVRMLDKKDGGTRPITIAAAVWRILVSCVVSQLTVWILSWLSPEVVGGAPGCDLEDLLARFEDDLEQALFDDDIKLAGASINVSKFFDSIFAEMCFRALERAGLPECIASTMRRFYDDINVFFVDGNTVDPRCVKRVYGLLQGCAFSLVMVLILMCIWAAQVKVAPPMVQTGVFVDDRLLWCSTSTSADAFGQLHIACDITTTFDNAVGLVQNIGKGCCFSTAEEDEARLRVQLPHVGNVVREFEYVGIEYCTDPESHHCAVPFKPARMAKVIKRFKKIKRVGQTRKDRILLSKSAVTPVIRWGGAWRTYRDEDIKKLEVQMELCVLNSSNTWSGRSPWLIWQTTLDPTLHPQFLVDFEALTFVVRRHRRALCNHFRAHCNANFSAVCTRWGWLQLSATTFRTDEGVVDITCISKAVATRLATQGWSRWHVAIDNRMTPIPLTREYVTSSHVEAVCAAGSWLTRWAALAALVDHRLPRMHKVPTAPCRCGVDIPERLHWAYDCDYNSPVPALPAERHFHRRLSLPIMNAKQTFATTRPSNSRCSQKLARWLDGASTAGVERILIATDGSRHIRVPLDAALLPAVTPISTLTPLMLLSLPLALMLMAMMTLLGPVKLSLSISLLAHASCALSGCPGFALLLIASVYNSLLNTLFLWLMAIVMPQVSFGINRELLQELASVSMLLLVLRIPWFAGRDGALADGRSSLMIIPPPMEALTLFGFLLMARKLVGPQQTSSLEEKSFTGN